MCESWSSRMMTLRGPKEAPWPGGGLFSIDTSFSCIWIEQNLLQLKHPQLGRFRGKNERCYWEKCLFGVGTRREGCRNKLSFSKRIWPRRTWRWRCRGWKTRPGTWGLSWKCSTLKWWDASILFPVFKSWSQLVRCFYFVCSVFSSWSCSRRTRSRTTTGRWRNYSKTVIRRSLCTLSTSTWDNWIS